MRIARRTLLTSMIASVAAPAVFRGARASATSVGLKLHHFFSSVSCGHDRFLVPWVRKVEAESAGRIRIDIFPSMQLGGAPAQLFDQARDGFADIVWAMPGSTPGRFAQDRGVRTAVRRLAPGVGQFTGDPGLRRGESSG